jgi:aryl-alcohol dehydrogenase-like predicted oxidoreductase
MIEDRATPEGTARFRDRSLAAHHLPATHFRASPSGLALSSLGLGTYLGRADGPTDRSVEEAVSVSIRSGRINVVDTAINYRSQRAERSVGRALERSFASKAVRRDEIFVSSKIGYLAPDGESDLPPGRWIETELLETGVLDRSDIAGGSHAMSPSYLHDQLDRSLRNLRLSHLDLLYLHNAPESQLPELGPAVFEERLRLAFQQLELERSQGRIGSYGLATWDSLRGERVDAEHLELETALRVAREVGGQQHGFRFVQFPFNSSMPEAGERLSQRVDGRPATLLQAVGQLGLASFTSVPLLQGRLARGAPSGKLTPAQSALQFARSAPGNLAALFGAKSPEHLAEDLALADHPPAEA